MFECYWQIIFLHLFTLTFVTNPDPASMNIFKTVKRKTPFLLWEPIYIGTNGDPFYDERLTWEGRKDKVTQVRQGRAPKGHKSYT